MFPDIWKVAWVTPVFKESDKTNKSSYRPISALPVLSRIFEKLIFNQLYQYLEENCFLSTNQSGFRTLNSTTICIIKYCEDWYVTMDSGEITGLVLIDLKKAFDNVDHNILCKKLEHYGVNYRELCWLKSYLSNRRQFCRVNGVDSKIESIATGVPQGSCFGPLLLLLYINDLPYVVNNSSVSMYAGDTSLCSGSRDIKMLNAALNVDLERLESWLRGNRLSMNVQTKSLLIASKQKQKSLLNNDKKLTLAIRGRDIEAAPHMTYLGIYIHDTLNWKNKSN